jgi:hypothetical protein
MLHVRREGDDLESCFPAVIEPCAGAPAVTAVRELAVEAGGPDAGRAVAVEVTTRFGQTDFLFSSLETNRVAVVSNGARACGKLAFVSRDAHGLRLLHLVGGRELSLGGVSVQVERETHASRIRSVDYAGRTVTLEDPLPGEVLAGEVLTVGNGSRRVTCRVESTSGNSLVMARTASAYRGGVETVTDAGNAVLDVEPYLHGYHPGAYEGMTAVNESGQVLGRASVTLGDRFFYTGWPASRRHLNRIDPADVTDADGDGRTTVAMIATVPQRKRREDGGAVDVAPGEKMLDLEVTRIREDGLMIWTRQHPRVFLDALGAPHPGWPYHRQAIRNERGGREWTVNMPGDTYELRVEGRALRATDFGDVDGDGRGLVTLYHYGPGDFVRVPTHVYLRRLESGAYELRANAACTLVLPGGAPSLSRDGGASWTPLPAEAVGHGHRLSLGRAELGSGCVQLRLGP